MMRRFGLRDDQWERIKDLLPGRLGHVVVTAADNRLFVEAVLYRYRTGMPWRDSRLEGGSYALYPVGQGRRLGAGLQASGQGRRQRIRDDRFDHRACSSTQRRSPKKAGQDEAIGRSNGGLSTKINATVDALGNPIGFALTPGQACDLDGADILLPPMEADIVIADKGFDADERVSDPLEKAGKTTVIPPKANRKHKRDYDKELYKARHLIENFFAKLKQFRAIATRYDKRAINFLAGIYLAAIIIWLN